MAWVLGVALLLVCTVTMSGACLDGWVGHEGMCYHFSNEIEDWTGAKLMCDIMTGQLVEIETARENFFLGKQTQLYNREYWIALTDVSEEGIWMWMNSRQHPSYTNWAPNEPNNDGQENCVDIYPGGAWNDAECRYYKHYICEMAEEKGVIIGK